MQERRNPEPGPSIEFFPACRLANSQTPWLSLSQDFAEQQGAGVSRASQASSERAE